MAVEREQGAVAVEREQGAVAVEREQGAVAVEREHRRARDRHRRDERGEAREES